MSEDPKAVVRAFMAAMERLDYDAALEMVTDDVVYTNVPLSTVTGPDGIRGVLEPFFAPTIENTWVVHRVVADGDTVVMERTDRHRLAKGWVELPVVGVFVVHDGRIAEWRDYFDLATIMTGFAEKA